MRYDVFVDCDLIFVMDKLVMFFSKWYKHESEAFSLDMDIVESFHHFSARFYQIGQCNHQAFDGLFDRQSAGIDRLDRQLRFQIFVWLGYGDVACQAQKKLWPNFKRRDPESKGDILPAVLHRFGQVGDPNQIGIGLKINAGYIRPYAPERKVQGVIICCRNFCKFKLLQFAPDRIPGGIAVFVETTTDNLQRTVSHVRAIFNKKGPK